MRIAKIAQTDRRRRQSARGPWCAASARWQRLQAKGSDRAVHPVERILTVPRRRCDVAGVGEAKADAMLLIERPRADRSRRPRAAREHDRGARAPPRPLVAQREWLISTPKWPARSES